MYFALNVVFRWREIVLPVVVLENFTGSIVLFVDQIQLPQIELFHKKRKKKRRLNWLPSNFKLFFDSTPFFYKICSAYGEMAERLIATVLKTVVPQGTQGSNPCLSAMQYIKIPFQGDFL
jgi:hypothetical protein